ncbi:MAG: efflux transporter outer membrane subunit [Chlamydiales bacterium]
MRQIINPKITLLGLILSGCQVGSQYQTPEIPIAHSWKTHPTMVAHPPVQCWWEVFQDPQLGRLMDQAIHSNPSLLAASQRVEQARDFAKVAKSRLFPQLNFDPSASNAPSTVHTLGSASNPPPVLVKNHIDKYTLPFTLLYEFDFWGKWRSQYQSALFQAESEVEGYRTSLLLLTTDLANAYFQLRIQDAQIDVLREILQTRKTALHIQQSRYETQLIDYTDVTTYQTDYSTVEAEYYDALRTRVLFENQIAVLIGTSPSEFKLDPMPLRTLPPQIPVDLPAKVLLRRPDVAEQERKMAALHAEINVAYASYFPSIDLTGVLDILSNDFIKTVKNNWLIGGNLIEILFDAGERRSNVELFTAKFNEAVASYREKILAAFQEVEDSLASLDWIAHEMESIDTAIDATQISHKIALDRYKFGLSSYLGAANRERMTLDEKRRSLQLLQLRYLHTIHLIKAIGGGWE